MFNFMLKKQTVVLPGCDLSVGTFKWKEGLQQKASAAFLRHQEAAPNLRKLVYGSGILFVSSITNNVCV